MRERKAARRVIAAIGLAVALAEGTANAGSEEREQCATSGEQAQQLRDEGKYRRAREQMLVCARDVCPPYIRADCSRWLSDLDRDAPTVVFGAREAGKDIADVKVTMDGTVIAERLEGKPLLVDSGEHTFRFEHRGATREEKVIVRAAEKARPIIVTFGAEPAAPPTRRDVPAKKQESSSGGSLVPAVIVGGIGIAALGSFAIFGIQGKNDVDDLQQCKPRCAETDVDKARTKLRIADVSLGIGVVALAVATYLVLTRPKSDASAKVQANAGSLRLTSGPGTAGLGLGASF